MKRLMALIVLAGCTAAPPPLPPQLEDTCGAANFAGLIGQDVTALETRLHLGMVRVIRPGDLVTQDFRPGRINFMIGEDNVIGTINCG
ncbi:I78 family peptidase inhibitor [Loktanella sp. Alg231-35]|uniref:I78 family peptidase inhibitor n=1 Tax=Loktanella sp. Alg231-35 TaxID=1922220 RepID=UPI000D553829|nr:I78 family peptidase inhibitor [Loktanella sp. Alg231-35]